MSSSSDESQSELIRARDVEGFDVWALPSFDPEPPEPEPEPEEVQEEIEEVPLEEVQPLTLEELESIRQEAYNEGFATGEKEGFHSTTLKVRQEAEVALSAKLQALEQLMANLFEPIAEQDTQIEKTLVELVRHITRQVIQRELAMDSTQIEHVMREALKLLPLGVGNVRLYVIRRISSRSKACASAMRKAGASSRTKRCCPAVVGSRPSTAVSMPAWKPGSPRPWTSCPTSCTNNRCIRQQRTLAWTWGH